MTRETCIRKSLSVGEDLAVTTRATQGGQPPGPSTSVQASPDEQVACETKRKKFLSTIDSSMG